MAVIRTDVGGGGGARLQAAIAAMAADPGLSVALLPSAVPMRSRTVAERKGHIIATPLAPAHR